MADGDLADVELPHEGGDDVLSLVADDCVADDWETGALNAVALWEQLWAAHPTHLRVRWLLSRAHRNRYHANRFRHIID